MSKIVARIPRHVVKCIENFQLNFTRFKYALHLIRNAFKLHIELSTVCKMHTLKVFTQLGYSPSFSLPFARTLYHLNRTEETRLSPGWKLFPINSSPDLVREIKARGEGPMPHCAIKIIKRAFPKRTRARVKSLTVGSKILFNKARFVHIYMNSSIIFSMSFFFFWFMFV